MEFIYRRALKIIGDGVLILWFNLHKVRQLGLLDCDPQKMLLLVKSTKWMLIDLQVETAGSGCINMICPNLGVAFFQSRGN
ncbi:hypothetical protein L1987_25227 [Smallanthus sonchifolius]|uniref:Uncharacterized protein n=1 Tax=Smallanthus sonchifolius TaxID=185202 RepID=A0ACB9IN70_9ASTR|nr:hypothetical protein L1987_25227 [Smallanthus sonchifolius]